MADQKPTTPGPRAPEPPQVERLNAPQGRRLPEPFYLVRDEVTFPQMIEKGLAPLKRERGISETNARKAGIELPEKE